jgi:hypothetical protein
VRLEEIYERIARWVFDDALAPVEAVPVEVEVERELIVGDLEMIKLLVAAQDAGKQIIAVSDTYFSAGLREPEALREAPAARPARAAGAVAAAVRSRLHVGRSPHEQEWRHVRDRPAHALPRRTRGAARRRQPGGRRRVPAPAWHPPGFFERRPEPFASVDAKEARFRPTRSQDLRYQTLASGLTAARTKVLSRPELIGIPTALQRCSARC